MFDGLDPESATAKSRVPLWLLRRVRTLIHCGYKIIGAKRNASDDQRGQHRPKRSPIESEHSSGPSWTRRDTTPGFESQLQGRRRRGGRYIVCLFFPLASHGRPKKYSEAVQSSGSRKRYIISKWGLPKGDSNYRPYQIFLLASW